MADTYGMAGSGDSYFVCFGKDIIFRGTLAECEAYYREKNIKLASASVAPAKPPQPPAKAPEPPVNPILARLKANLAKVTMKES